jgi:hypothetical protein
MVVALSLISPVLGDTPPAINALIQKLTAACQAHDLEAIKACYDTTDAAPEEVDLALSTWQEYLNQGGDATNWKFVAATYRSLVELRADKSVNPAFFSSLGRHRMGEHFYDDNVAPVGFVTVSFHGDKGSSAGNMSAVGINSLGVALLSLSHRVN